MPERTASRATSKQAEAVVEPQRDLARCEHSRSHGCELDGERQTVKPTAYLRNGLDLVWVREHLSSAGCLRALNEQPHCRRLQKVSPVGRGGRQLERRNGPRNLTPDAQRFAACRHDVQLG